MAYDAIGPARFGDDRGQGLTEYIILVGLIALLVYGMVKFFGNSVGGMFNSAGNKVTSISSEWK